MKPLYVHGTGFWAEGYPTLAAYCSKTPDVSERKPEAALLQGASKRRASLLTRMAVEVFGQAAGEAGADLSSVNSVWAIVHGEINTAVELMGMMQAGEGKLSPAKFHNSVYNTASGYASIACANRAPSSTLTGGPEIVGAALVEAAGLLQAGAEQVVVVWADEVHPAPFESSEPREPLAMALCLSQQAAGSLACISHLRREPAGLVPATKAFQGLHISAALPLLEGIETRAPGELTLDRGVGESLCWTGELSFA